MKPLVAPLALAALLYSASSLAIPCSNFAYEELKDMKTEELKHEICTARRNASDANQRAFDMLISMHSDDAAETALEAEASQCTNEVTRIQRILSKVDPASSVDLEAMCKSTR